MRGTVLYGPRDIRFEEREAPKILKPTDAIIRVSATCVCGSDLWPYRGINPISQPTPMGHEYCGVVEEIGSAVNSIKRGQFVIGSFLLRTIRVRTATTGIRLPARTGSSWAMRKHRCSVFRSRMARSCPRPAFRRAI